MYSHLVPTPPPLQQVATCMVVIFDLKKCYDYKLATIHMMIQPSVCKLLIDIRLYNYYVEYTQRIIHNEIVFPVILVYFVKLEARSMYFGYRWIT